MPGGVVHLGAQVVCMHMGQAMPTAVSSNLIVVGQPVVLLTAPYSVAGCPFVPPGGTGPCATAQWMVGATRVTSFGTPLVIQSGVAVCVPTGTGLQVLAVQSRVTAT
jgi:hypothetical protein